jgi:hypothetical protein
MERAQHVPLTTFLRSHGISARDLEIRNDLVFVLTPFHEELLDEYKAIVSVGESLGLQVIRGDERSAPGEIFGRLLKYLVQARLVVANISGRNPNVFYELGIAHALGKVVVLVANKKGDVPFDVQSRQIVFYENNANLESNLTKAITAALATKDD